MELVVLKVSEQTRTEVDDVDDGTVVVLISWTGRSWWLSVRSAASDMAGLSNALKEEARALLANNYCDLACIGQGAFGVVFRGVQRAMGEERAIKVMKMDGDMLVTVVDTAAAAAERHRSGDVFAIGLQHPYIARVFDVSVLVRAEQLVAVVMESIKGETLVEQLARERHRLRQKDADMRNALLISGFVARVTACMLSALEYCGRRGIVHQDIKPDNIMVCTDEGVPCKLIDFGLAGVVRDGAYLRGGDGTIAYIAPEKLRGEPFSARADVYSFGVVVYEMVMLSLPDGKPVERAAKKESVVFPVEMPPAYRRMLADMLQSDAKKRPKAEVVSMRFQMTEEFSCHCERRVEMVSGVSAMRKLVERDYEGVEYVGGGAFGQVFKGQHRLMRGEWAVKVVDAGARIGEVLLVDVRHEHLARVYFVVKMDAYMCVHMELARGVPLTLILSECAEKSMDGGVNRLTESGAAWWMMEAMVKAVACLEEHRIIHEDIKPDNVLVDEGSRRLKVIGFAHSKRVDEDSEPSVDVYYCAPERLRGEAHDCRADVYSAGAVMWEIVMLRPLAESEVDAKRRAREFVNAELMFGDGKFAQRVTRMLKSRPAERVAASVLLSEICGARRTVELEQEIADLRQENEEMQKRTQKRIEDAQQEIAVARRHADRRVASALAVNDVAQKRNSELEAKIAELEQRLSVRAPSGVVVSKSENLPDALMGMRVASSVGEAVRAATSGVTVYVLPGEYRESVVVDKDVTVVGWGFTATGGIGVEESALRVKIIGSDAGPALTVTSNATVRGLRLEHTSTSVYAVEVTNGSGWVIEGCSVSAKASGQGMAGVLVSNGSGTLRSCTVSECGMNGIFLRGSSDVTVEKCKVVRNKNFGVYVMDKAKVRVVQCECMDNDCGLLSGGDSDVVADQCKMVRNKSHGVSASDKSKSRVVECECAENAQNGVVTWHDSQCTVERCRLVNNGINGTARESAASHLSLSQCTFGGNKQGDRKNC
jgi:parallel beta-helix repeat protein